MSHDVECMCSGCLIADMEAHVIATQGQEAADRINVQMSAMGEGKVEAVKTRSMKAGQRVGRGYVRSMSPKQKKFLVFLINTKITTNLKLLPGQTINLAEIDTMGLPAAKAVIDKLTACPDKPSNSVRMATDGQKRFIRSLNAQSDNTLTEADINSITFAEVNDVLALLKRMAQAWKEEKNNTTQKSEITEGAYWHGKLIARVQRTKDGKRMYAKLQAEEGSKVFNYAPGVMGQLKAENRLSLQDMRVFAQQWKACADCGTPMRHPMSIARGVGPVCSGKGYTEI